MDNWTKSPTPILALAPMADMTDSAYCQIARQASGGDFVVFREMVNSEALIRGNQRTLDMCRFAETERPIVQQIFGGDPKSMAGAVRIVDEKHDPNGFDINMGCPAKKIVGNFNGSALMRDPRKAGEIVKAMKAATEKPVTVKCRLGWSKPDEILEFSKRIEDAGAELLTVHGRTKEQGYSGQADWEMIGRAKRQLSIPVILNGDVVDGPTAKQALGLTGCDGLMVGRGSLGNPWIFAEIKAFLNNEPYENPNRDSRLQTIVDHATLHAATRPEEPRPMISLRAHLIHYLKGEAGAKGWREAVVKAETVDDIRRLISHAPTGNSATQ